MDSAGLYSSSHLLSHHGWQHLLDEEHYDDAEITSNVHPTPATSVQDLNALGRDMSQADFEKEKKILSSLPPRIESLPFRSAWSEDSKSADSFTPPFPQGSKRRAPRASPPLSGSSPLLEDAPGEGTFKILPSTALNSHPVAKPASARYDLGSSPADPTFVGRQSFAFHKPNKPFSNYGLGSCVDLNSPSTKFQSSNWDTFRTASRNRTFAVDTTDLSDRAFSPVRIPSNSNDIVVDESSLSDSKVDRVLKPVEPLNSNLAQNTSHENAFKMPVEHASFTQPSKSSTQLSAFSTGNNSISSYLKNSMSSIRSVSGRFLQSFSSTPSTELVGTQPKKPTTPYWAGRYMSMMDKAMNDWMRQEGLVLARVSRQEREEMLHDKQLFTSFRILSALENEAESFVAKRSFREFKARLHAGHYESDLAKMQAALLEYDDPTTHHGLMSVPELTKKNPPACGYGTRAPRPWRSESLMSKLFPKVTKHANGV